MTVNLSEIDAEHAAIGEAWLATMRCRVVALPFHVARLAKVMRQHFDHEARLVEAAGTPFCWCHHNEHEAMLAVCGEALSTAEHDPRKARALCATSCHAGCAVTSPPWTRSRC